MNQSVLITVYCTTIKFRDLGSWELLSLVRVYTPFISEKYKYLFLVPALPKLSSFSVPGPFKFIVVFFYSQKQSKKQEMQAAF